MEVVCLWFFTDCALSEWNRKGTVLKFGLAPTMPIFLRDLLEISALLLDLLSPSFLHL